MTASPQSPRRRRRADAEAASKGRDRVEGQRPWSALAAQEALGGRRMPGPGDFGDAAGLVLPAGPITLNGGRLGRRGGREEGCEVLRGRPRRSTRATPTPRVDFGGSGAFPVGQPEPARFFSAPPRNLALANLRRPRTTGRRRGRRGVERRWPPRLRAEGARAAARAAERLPPHRAHALPGTAPVPARRGRLRADRRSHRGSDRRGRGGGRRRDAGESAVRRPPRASRGRRDRAPIRSACSRC